MKIFMEKMARSLAIVVQPVGCTLVRPNPVRAAHPQFDQPIGQLVRDLFESEVAAGSGRAFHFEIVAVIMVKLLERLNQKVIGREPDWSAPVGVASKHSGL